MTVVNMNRNTYTALNSAAKRLQVFGGRVQVADSASPAENDFHVWPEGSVIDVTAIKYGRAVDTTTTWVVALDV